MVRTLNHLLCGLLMVAAIFPSIVAADEEVKPASSEATSTPIPAPANDTVAPVEMTPPTLAAVVEQLSPESRKKFADLLSKDWKKRPEWADMLIVLLKGDNMGPGAGWFKPGEKRYDWKWLSERFDADANGSISPEELGVKESGANQFFSRLDRDNDGVLQPADFDYVGRQPATPPFMISQYVATLVDSDTNGRITPEELAAFLKRADADKTGFITSEDMYREFNRMLMERDVGGVDMPRQDRLLPMFFKGEFGTLESGPGLGEMAPDFTLPTHDGSDSMTLSRLQGKPVILIFGSFTCGPFRSQAGLLDKLYARYKDQVHVYAVYIRDAHPTDGWKMKSNELVGINVAQPKTQADRNLVASQCCQTLKLTMPLLVDTIDDTVNRAYSGFPDRLYLIDRTGKIAYKGGRGPFGYKPRELEQTLLMMLIDEELAKTAAPAAADAPK